MTRTQPGTRLDCLVHVTLSLGMFGTGGHSSSQPLPLVRQVTQDTLGEASSSPVYSPGRLPGLGARRL